MPRVEFDSPGWHRWNIPKKVEWVDIDIFGAGSNGVRGGRVTGRINVKGRESLHVLVGEKGTRGGERTTGGGGPAGTGSESRGWSGGGATWVRMNSRTGALKAVAGAAGGTSGDDGLGGAGGGDVAEAGQPAPGYPGGSQPDLENRPTLWAYRSIGNATGGTQIQGGQPGQSSYAADLNGSGAKDTNLSGGGKGASSDRGGTFGGGGGGGGYRGGGGGQAGLLDETPGGGGGGGSSFTGGLTGETNAIGEGAAGDGRARLSWVTPPPANQPPVAPTDVKIGGRPYTDAMSTLSRGQVSITAKIGDPNSKRVQLVVYYAPDRTFKQRQVSTSKEVERGKRAEVTLKGLSGDTLWHARLYTRDASGMLSRNYTTVNFWTNRAPSAPELISPGENASIGNLDAPLFAWHHLDPDHPENPTQRGFSFEWRRAGTPVTRPGDWNRVSYTTDDETYVGEAESFKANTAYEWRVRTQDEQSRWGEWSLIRSFYVTGTTAPAWPTSPVRGEAVDILDGVTFEWRFRSPVPGAAQATADVRYRLVGSDQWVTIPGDALDPGPIESLTIPTPQPGHYEWSVRTHANPGAAVGDWTDTERFRLVSVSAVTEAVVPDVVSTEATLGCGHNEVHIYRRGGELYVGRLTPNTEVTWGRRRDDISIATIRTNGAENSQLLLKIGSWTHEVVIFRDKKRVWEGPITQWTDAPGGFVIQAKDVLGYPYRRIMRQGYNDAYRIVNNVQLGQKTVVQRARQILMNALAPDNPNVLGYLTTLDYPDDARQSRSVPDFSKMAWEELDDMAATSGLDYTAVGRRIILWDTHRAVGRLPEIRAAHFSDPPVVTEYGMLLATDFGVTNNAGVYGTATRRGREEVGPYGIVEQLASAYGETESGGATETLTSTGQAELERTLTTQAQRNIANRWPTPVVVRVPDNSTLHPETPVDINHLVPGVWIPLRTSGTVRQVAQWQKLDSLTVTQTKDGEKVMVTMSPAPNRGSDPDAEVQVED